MAVNAFGYEVASLNELIEQLTAARDAEPAMGDLPVWVKNFPGVIPAILRLDNVDARGLTILVQRGYDR